MSRIEPGLVVVIGLFVAAITALILFGKDPTVLLTFINTAGLALLLAETRTIKQQTNGTLHRTMSIVERVAVQNGQSTEDTSTKTQAT